MSKKSKMGGCKKKIRPHKVSKGQRRSIATHASFDGLLLNANEYGVPELKSVS